MLNKGSIFTTNRDDKTPTGNSRVTTSTSTTSSQSSFMSGAGASAPAPARETAPMPEPSGAKLVVGPGVKLKGAEILDCDTLLVEGRVEATMDSHLIQIADQGSFDGKVNIDVAEIRGRFNGELTARDSLVIHSTGRVSGKIRYGKIVVHEGGEVSGDIKSLNSSEASLSSPKSSEAANTAAHTSDSGVAALNQLLAKTA